MWPVSSCVPSPPYIASVVNLNHAYFFGVKSDVDSKDGSLSPSKGGRNNVEGMSEIACLFIIHFTEDLLAATMISAFFWLSRFLHAQRARDVAWGTASDHHQLRVLQLEDDGVNGSWSTAEQQCCNLSCCRSDEVVTSSTTFVGGMVQNHCMQLSPFESAVMLYLPYRFIVPHRSVL